MKHHKVNIYFDLFTTFFRIGAFTIGGGYAMLPLIERETINKGWLTKEEFIDSFTIAQALPGVFAVNISIFVGYKFKGFKGSIMCALGAILPSFLMILGIALFFTQFRENEIVIRVFKALRPTVVALIAVPVFSTWKALNLSWRWIPIPIVVAFLIWYAGVSPILIVFIAGILGLGLNYYKTIKKR